jgi:hypothetical protein
MSLINTQHLMTWVLLNTSVTVVEGGFVISCAFWGGSLFCPQFLREIWADCHVTVTWGFITSDGHHSVTYCLRICVWPTWCRIRYVYVVNFHSTHPRWYTTDQWDKQYSHTHTQLVFFLLIYYIYDDNMCRPFVRSSGPFPKNWKYCQLSRTDGFLVY